MLDVLKISNMAVIDKAEVSFGEGLNILSGETGAGKSIVIQAISLLLGSRASADIIRTGTGEAAVEGFFNISEMPWMIKRLEKLGLDADEKELLVKRVISREGKHRIHINGNLATLSILREACEDLVDLCGQHEHQSLLKANIQLNLLDKYGGLEKEAETAHEAFSKVRSIKEEIERLRGSEEEFAKKADFLSFQINELRSAELKSGEDDDLQNEKQALQSVGQRMELADAARKLIESDGDSEGALDSIRGAITRLRSLEQLDNKAGAVLKSLENALLSLEDASIGLNRYLESADLDPEKLEHIQSRLSLIAQLKRKYGASTDEMLSALKKMEEELNVIQKTSERVSELSLELEKAEAELTKIGKKLSKARKATATSFSTAVTSELKELNMKDAHFLVEIESKDNLREWTASGIADIACFTVQTNKGDVFHPMSKIASGGELSRLMLAVRRVIADKGGIGVYLFDEIDAGIGGQTAFEVGKKLKSVSKNNQVICITHLPQVASFADQHLSVRKNVKKDRTMTEVIKLDPAGRKEELARMLGGPRLTETSLKNAAELMQMAGV